MTDPQLQKPWPNDLIADKNKLVGIAQAFEQELVAQVISDKEITYITTEILPLVEQLTGLAGGDDDDPAAAVNALKSLVTPETLTIMQLVGFNFRRAIGEPLTNLVERLIDSRAPLVPARSEEFQVLQLRREIARLEALKDPDARQVLIQGDQSGATGS
jgi:hypothetical protein